MMTMPNAVAAAEPTPNFSGDWCAEPPPPGRVLDAPTRGSMRESKPGLTITQDAKQIVLASGSLVEAYALDGSESTCMLRIAQKPVAVPCRARWDGRRLVMTYQVPLRAEPRDLTRTLSFDDNGGLVIETTDTSPTTGAAHHVGRYTRQGGIA